MGCKENLEQKLAKRNYHFPLWSPKLLLYIFKCVVFKIFFIYLFCWYFSPFFAHLSGKGEEYYIRVCVCIYILTYLPFYWIRVPRHSERITGYKSWRTCTQFVLCCVHFCLPRITSSWSIVAYACIVVHAKLRDSAIDIDKTY